MGRVTPRTASACSCASQRRLIGHSRLPGRKGPKVAPSNRRREGWCSTCGATPAVLTLARVALALRNGPVQADGRPFSVAEGIRGGDGSGVLKVAAAGDFGAGDNIVFDLNSDGKAARPEVLTLNGSLASGVFSLEEVVPGTYSVLYFPGQEDPLRSSAIRTTFVVDFEKSTNRAPPAVRETVELEYLNADTALPAYAIAAPSARDRTQVRIRCQSSVPCRVYLSCDGADGSHYFGGLDGLVGRREVRTLTAHDVAVNIGASDLDFAGGMSCEVFGSDISVQVLTRSGGVLANTTYVGGRLEESVRVLVEEAARAASLAAESPPASMHRDH